MANTSTPWGLRPLFMTEARKTAMLLPITINYATALFTNDPVTGVTAGTIERATTGAILTIGTILGIYQQQTPYSLGLERLLPVQYYPASTATKQYFALVTTDPNMFFTAQEDGDTTPLTAAMTFSNCDIVWPSPSGNTATGISYGAIDSNTMAVTATLMVRLIRPWLEYYDTGGNSYNHIATTAAPWCKWIVRINNYQFGDNTLGLA
jgi:hypothetical protein